MSWVDYQVRCFKVSGGVYMSCVNHQERNFKVGKSICHVLITRKEVLKLRSLYVMC